ncbi:MAG: phosphoribosyltransferase [Thermoanaerobaculia bacterium]
MSSPSQGWKLEKKFEADRIAARVADVAAELDRRYRDRRLALVCVLKGAAFFLADLARRLSIPVSCEYISVRREEGGEILQIDFTTDFAAAGRPIVLLKDVVYSGVVETYLAGHLRDKGAASVEIAAILDKPGERKMEVAVDFPLFSTEGGIFVGYGMAHDGSGANLPYVAEIVEGQ